MKSFDLNDLLTLWLSHYNKKCFWIQWKYKTVAKCCCARGDLDGSDSSPLLIRCLSKGQNRSDIHKINQVIFNLSLFRDFQGLQMHSRHTFLDFF